MADNIPGLLGQYGIDPRSPEELELEKQTQQRLMAAGIAGQSNPGYRQGYENAAYSAGSKIGALAGSAMAPARLTDRERDSAEALQDTMSRFRQWRAQNPNATPDELQDRQQKMLAEALILRGDPRGAQMAAGVVQRSKSRKMQDLQIQNLEQGVKAGKTRQEESEFDLMTKKGLFGLKDNVWLAGETDPNKSKSGFVSPGDPAQGIEPGSFLYFDENGQQQVVPPGQWSGYAPDGTGVVGSIEVNKSEAEKIRNKGLAVTSVARSGLNMIDAMKEAVAADPKGQLNILSSGGAVNDWVVGTIDNFGQVYRQSRDLLSAAIPGFKEFTVLDENKREVKGGYGNSAASDDFVEKNFDELNSMFEDEVDRLGAVIPDSIRTNQAARAKFLSALTRMAYARARAEEPGGRLSDEDFKRAVTQLAGAATSPEALRQVLTQSLKNDVADFELHLEMLGDKGRRKIMSDASYNTYRDAVDRFYEATSKPFGSARNPGTGLTPDPTAPVELGDGWTIRPVSP